MAIGGRRWRAAGAVGLSTLAWLAPSPARAEDKRSIRDALLVDRSCIERDRLAEAITRYRGRSVVDAAVTLEVRGDPLAERGVTLRLSRGGAVFGERRFARFEGPCARAEEALALAAALALDANELRDVGLLPAPVPIPPASAPEPPPSPPSSAHLVTTADAFVLVGTLHTTAVGVAPAIGVVPPSARFRATVGAWMTMPVNVAVGAGAARVTTLLGRLDACVAPLVVDRVHLWTCTAVAAGTLHAPGVGFTASFEPTAAFVPVFGRGEVEVALAGGLSLRAAGEVVVTTLGADIGVENREEVIVGDRPLPSVGAAFTVGLGATIF